MNYLITILFSFLLFQTLSAQDSTGIKTPAVTISDSTHNDSTVLVYVEKMPQFPGGEKALYEYISKNIKYPNTQKEGLVVVQFVVEKNGAISNVIIVRGIKEAPELDAEAIRVISAMPNWIPAEVKGSTVRSKFLIPIKFSKK